MTTVERRGEPPEWRVEDMFAVLVYAEVRAIMLAWAGIRGTAVDAVESARRTVVELATTWRGGRRGFVAEARTRLREASRQTLAAVVERTSLWPFRRAPPGAVGSLDGLEAVFHDAGVHAVAHREHDRHLLAAAVSLTELVRRCRATTAGAEPSPDQVDTARIVAMTRPGLVRLVQRLQRHRGGPPVPEPVLRALSDDQLRDLAGRLRRS